ncbi:MAG: PD-(D/E)XK nuclease family protein [Actinomycetota bacterium]
MRLSYSALSAYENCPLSYRFQYVDGMEVEPTPYLSFGKSLHAALEWLYGRATPEPPSLEGLLSYLDECWLSEGYATAEEEKSFHSQGREVLTLFYYKNIEDFRLPVAVEERFELDKGGFILSGVIDRVDRNPDGSYEIIDYKTSRRLPELSRLRADLQLPIYQIACREIWGITPSKLSFYYLMHNQRYSTRPYDEEGLAGVIRRLEAAAEAISRQEFPATPNRLCPWCSFQDICPERVPSLDLAGGYRQRRAALLRRRDRLERTIAELEEEMAGEGICLEEPEEENGI